MYDQKQHDRIAQTCARITASVMGDGELMDRYNIAASQPNATQTIEQMLEDAVVAGTLVAERAYARITKMEPEDSGL